MQNNNDLMNKLCMHSQRKVHLNSDLSVFTLHVIVFNIPRTRAPGLNLFNKLIYEKLHLMGEFDVLFKRNL